MEHAALKGKFTTFHEDVQSVLMVYEVDCSNKFLSAALLAEKTEFFLLAEPCSRAYMNQDALHVSVLSPPVHIAITLLARTWL